LRLCSPLADELGWARDAFPHPRLYDDYAALLADPTVDAVLARHAVVVARAADYRRAARGQACVLREAAVAGSDAECERVLAEAARYPHLQATIGFMRRFDPSYRDAFDKDRERA
jgi:myo-inositol 2-dehydrogenase/D-chiro-inositol 1-dehydrogenase